MNLSPCILSPRPSRHPQRAAIPAPEAAGFNTEPCAIRETRGTSRAAEPQSLLRISRYALRSGFTLVEIMVTVGLLSFIILGLLMMFNQTQRVFRSSMTQSDMLESGRAVTEMLAQDIQQMQPSQAGGMYTNRCTNFYAEISVAFNPPMLQGLPGSPKDPTVPPLSLRTNIVQNIYFLTLANQTWTGIGYAVLPATNTGVGSLYRFALPLAKLSTNPISWMSGYMRQAMDDEIARAATNGPITNQYIFGQDPMSISRIADGIVHLRLRPFATNGYPLFTTNNAPGDSVMTTSGSLTNLTNGALFQVAVSKTNGFYMTNAVVRQTAVLTNTVGFSPDQPWGYAFWSNAVPASVELEIGILEPQTLRRFNAIGSASQSAQQQFLSNHVAQVQLFRQRFPIRAVDITAYQ